MVVSGVWLVVSGVWLVVESVSSKGIMPVGLVMVYKVIDWLDLNPIPRIMVCWRVITIDESE